MFYRTTELKNKQIVCIENGGFMGYLGDVEINSDTGKTEYIIIYGRPRFFGLLGKTEDIVIPWENIEVIGKETILISGPCKENTIKYEIK